MREPLSDRVLGVIATMLILGVIQGLLWLIKYIIDTPKRKEQEKLLAMSKQVSPDGKKFCFRCKKFTDDEIDGGVISCEVCGWQRRIMNTEHKIEAVHNPRGIAGWLLIPAIGLIFAPIISIRNNYIAMGAIKESYPELFIDIRFWVALLIDLAFIIATICVATFFFQKKRFVPQAFIGLMLATIIATIIGKALFIPIVKIFNFENFQSVVSICVNSAIWIPYFLISKRVKNTFIQ